MTQEDRPRFSHVVIGDDPSQEDRQSDEEVITIGGDAGSLLDDAGADTLLGDDVASVAAASDAAAAGVSAAGAGVAGVEPVAAGPVADADVGAGYADDADDADDDDDLGVDTPMPLVQRIVLICCGIGVVITAAFIAWHFIVPA